MTHAESTDLAWAVAGGVMVVVAFVAVLLVALAVIGQARR